MNFKRNLIVSVAVYVNNSGSNLSGIFPGRRTVLHGRGPAQVQGLLQAHHRQGAQGPRRPVARQLLRLQGQTCAFDRRKSLIIVH